MVLPDIALQVAFNADPNDTSATPTWTDLTSRVYKVGSAHWGRQYELDATQTGQMSVSFRDADEYLNPANASSTYYPNVLPYRQVLFQAMYPSGGTGNLMN